MTTRARNTADIVEDVDASLATKLDIVNQQSNRNLLYNGAMQVHQRGTSATGITGSSYNTADRWELALGTMGTWTNTVENDAPTGSGFRKSWKFLCTTSDSTPAAGDLIFMRQKLEGQDVQRIAKGTSAAQQLTVSFWVKSNVTGTYVAELRDFDNNRSVSAQYAISASGTWEKKTITFPADTTGVLDNDNALSLACQFWLGAGTDSTSGTLQTTWAAVVNANRAVGQTNLAAATNNYWQITGVQLEVGPSATEFEFKSFGQELAECQRYYQRFIGDVANAVLGTLGWGISTTIAAIPFSLTQEMRVKPSAVESSVIELTDLAAEYPITVALSPQSTPQIALVNATTTGLTQYRPYVIRNDNNAAGYIAFSAEL
jgi:hypothetical protein